MKSGNFNFLQTSGPLPACKGTALPLISELFFTKDTFARQHFVNNFYTEFLENPAVVTGDVAQTDVRRANAVSV